MNDSPVNQRYRAYLESEYAISLARGRYMPYLIVAIASAFLIPAALSRHWLLPAVAYFVVFLFATRGIALLRQDYRRRIVIADNWTPVVAVLVQANPGLFRAGMLDLPCLVLFSFEPLDYETLTELTERVAALKETTATETDRTAVAALLAPGPAVRRRRVPLPPALTGGATVYAADLFVNRRYLEKGYLTHRTLPCFAEPDATDKPESESGRGLELMPWQIAETTESAKIAEPTAPTKSPTVAKTS